MYIDYEYYKREYGGGLSETEFNRAEPDAEDYVNYLTMMHPGSIFEATDSRTVSALRRALCKAVDTIAAHNAAASSGQYGIKSESNDGYSVSRVTEASDGETSDSVLQRKVYAAVRMILLPTGWLYRGLGRCDCGGGLI